MDRGFESDPVKKWKTKISKEHLIENDDESEAPTTEIASSTFTASGDSDFQYLLSMAIMSLSKEKKDALLKQRDEKVGSLLIKDIPPDAERCLHQHVAHAIFSLSSVRNSPQQSANVEAFAEAYLCFLASASAKKMPRQLNS